MSGINRQQTLIHVHEQTDKQQTEGDGRAGRQTEKSKQKAERVWDRADSGQVDRQPDSRWDRAHVGQANKEPEGQADIEQAKQENGQEKVSVLI